MKKIVLTLCILLTTGLVYGQHQDHENHNASSEVEAVKKVLKSYKDALEKLDVSDTQKLFSDDANIFENGSYEGTYKQYLDHHIGPELGHFKEFSFDNYKVDIRMEGDIAIAYETYTYKIVTGGDNSRTIERRGAATSVLKKMDGTWTIIQNHGSSRALPTGN